MFFIFISKNNIPVIGRLKAALPPLVPYGTNFATV